MTACVASMPAGVTSQSQRLNGISRWVAAGGRYIDISSRLPQQLEDIGRDAGLEQIGDPGHVTVDVGEQVGVVGHDSPRLESVCGAPSDLAQFEVAIDRRHRRGQVRWDRRAFDREPKYSLNVEGASIRQAGVKGTGHVTKWNLLALDQYR